MSIVSAAAASTISTMRDDEKKIPKKVVYNEGFPRRRLCPKCRHWAEGDECPNCRQKLKD